MTDIDELINRIRSRKDCYPENWYDEIGYSDVLALCTAVESAIPALDLMQKRLEDGCYVVAPDEMNGHLWVLFRRDGEGITSGESLRSMLLNLMWLDTAADEQ